MKYVFKYLSYYLSLNNVGGIGTQTTMSGSLGKSIITQNLFVDCLVSKALHSFRSRYINPIWLWPFPIYWRFLTPLQQTPCVNIVEKRTHWSTRVIFPFAIMFSTLFSKYTLIYIIFVPCFCLDVYKVICSWFAVCGKGLKVCLVNPFAAKGN